MRTFSADPAVAELVEPPRGPVAAAAPGPDVLVRSGHLPPERTRGALGGRRLLGASLSILAALLLGFVAEVAFIGGVQHARDQRVAFADLRKELAEATAPVGQVDGNGRLNAFGRPLAILDIPAIGVREVVLEGTTGKVLQSGPGHRRDTVLPGQVGMSVIMGRQAAYGGPFGSLSELVPGDQILMTTGQGEHSYRVSGLRRTGDLQPPPLPGGKGRLTLVTSTGPAFVPVDVLRVDAELISEAAPAAARLLGPAALDAQEQAMAVDVTAWVPVLLLSQLLLLAAVILAWALVRWGRWPTWIVGVPLLAVLGLALAGEGALLLPNLL